MATLKDVYEDISEAKEKVNALFESVAWEADGDLSKGSDLADEASTLLNQVAADLAGLEQALQETRGE